MVSGREKFGTFIRREREAKGLSLRDMAKKIKVSPTFLSKVETEDWKPGEEKLRKIAEVIGCNPDDPWHVRVGFQPNSPRSSSKARIVIK